MNIVTQDILYVILLHTDNLTNIIVNKNIYNIIRTIFTNKLFWIDKLNYYDIYHMLDTNGEWVFDHYHKHHINLPICYKQVKDLRICQYVIIQGKPCKLIQMNQNRD